MNVEVVDDTMQDLDPFSLASKPVQRSPQPRAVEEVAKFRDLSKVALKNTLDAKDSDPIEEKLNLN